MPVWPALDVHPSTAGGTVHADFLLAALDDFQPTAVEERGACVRVFFATPERRDAARADLAAGALAGDLVATAIDVPDDGWARRSQADLAAVHVGRISIYSSGDAFSPQPSTLNPAGIQLVIPPSMGFGTGHHETTRLCLEALQTLDLRGARVLDAGTGSGVLAIAASRLGAREAIGIDHDPHAILAAREALALNPDARAVRFAVADLEHAEALTPAAEVVVANLTGATLIRAADVLDAAVRPGGSLIVSGLLVTELADVRQAFRALAQTWIKEEGDWAAIVFLKIR